MLVVATAATEVYDFGDVWVFQSACHDFLFLPMFPHTAPARLVTWYCWVSSGPWGSEWSFLLFQYHKEFHRFLNLWTVYNKIVNQLKIFKNESAIQVLWEIRTCFMRSGNQRNWALRVPWTARRSNQSILKEINTLFSGRTDAEALVLWPPDLKSWVIGKDPNAGKDGRQEEKGVTEDERVWWHHWLDMNLSKLQVMVKDREAWQAAVHGHK